MNEAEKNQPVRRVGRYAGKTQKLDSMIEQIQDEKAKDYIVSRIIPSMNYYSQKSRQYKNQYLWLMSMSIILGAMVPVCVLFTDSTTPIKVLLVFLSAGVLAVNMLLSVNSYKDLWLLYRNNRETLERTLSY